MSIPDYYWMADSDVIDINAMWLIVLTVEPLLIQLGKTLLQETSHQWVGDTNRMACIELMGQKNFKLLRTKHIVPKHKKTSRFQALEDPLEDGRNIEAMFQNIGHHHEVIAFHRIKPLDGAGDGFNGNPH